MHTLCKLPFFGVAEVSGADAAEFLHSQLSNHILDLQPGEACFATYNSPRGRVLANMLVLHRADRFLLVMAADLLEATIKRLRMFVLRSKTVFHTQCLAGVRPKRCGYGRGCRRAQICRRRRR